MSEMFIEQLKEIFSWIPQLERLYVVIGATGGFFALFKPIFEKHFSKDVNRANYVISLINEQDLVNLNFMIYNSRSIPSEFFSRFDRLERELYNKQDVVRFSGLLKKKLKRELIDLLNLYDELRDYIQVPEWHPEQRGEDFFWVLNKKEFDLTLSPSNDRSYAKHLERACNLADDMKIQLQRLQTVADLHIYEALFSWFILPIRFRDQGLIRKNKRS